MNEETHAQRVRRLEAVYKKAPTKDNKIALLEAQIRHVKSNSSIALSAARGRVEKRRTPAMFMAKFSEGARVAKELLGGEGTDRPLDEDRLAKAADLVAMLTDDVALAKYPTWELRAIALSMTPQQLWTLRQTKTYKKMLVEAIRGAAMENVAGAVGSQGEIAKSTGHKGSTAAFDKLGKVAGLEGPKSVKISQTNVSFETKMREAALGAAAAVEASFKLLPPKKSK